MALASDPTISRMAPFRVEPRLVGRVRPDFSDDFRIRSGIHAEQNLNVLSIVQVDMVLVAADTVHAISIEDLGSLDLIRISSPWPANKP